MSTPALDIRPLAPAMGAEISGVDLGKPVDDALFAALHAALLEHGAIFLRDQQLTAASQLAFARRFGALEVHPIVEGTSEHPEVIRVHKPAGERASFGVGWHSDNSFLERPSAATLLYATRVPPVGGDTLYASAAAAYEALSPPLRELVDGLHAVHSAARAYDPGETGASKYEGRAPIRYRWSEAVQARVRHPVVRTHPEMGRKTLFVNPMFTQSIEGLAPHESRALLDLLYAHCTRPEFTCRFRWQPGSVAMWDNRQVWHYAMDDYVGHERLMFRVTIAGDVPH